MPAALTVTSAALGGRGPVLPSAALLVAYLPGLILQMLTTGLAEEPGWRDFATPRLQRRYGPLLGTLILGPLWGAWHLPLFLSDWGGWPDVTWTEPVEFLRAELFDQDQRRFEVRFGRPEDESAAISIRIVDVLPPGRYRLSWVGFIPTHRHNDDGNILFTVLPRPPG